MNKQWFTAKEIAGLSNVPATESGIKRKAKREKWKFQKRQAIGGGIEYHISALPYETQQALRAKIIDEESIAEISDLITKNKEKETIDVFTKKKNREDALASFINLPFDKKERARAKEWIIRECREFISKNAYRKITGINTFCDQLKHDYITIPERYLTFLSPLHGHTHLNPSTLRGWEKKYNDLGIGGLVDGYGNRKGKSKIDTTEGLKEVVLGAVYENPHITGKKIKQYLEAAHADINIVSAKSIDRFLVKWKEENLHGWMMHTNPDQWKNTLMPAVGSHHENITEPNQLWEFDSTPGDWMLKDGRHSVIGVIDMFTRRMKLHVSKTSKSEAVLNVFRKAVLDWGVCNMARTDNGKDYVSVRFTTAMQDLEIPIDLCNPFASEEKGTVERMFRTMSHGILDQLKGFIGHNVQERKVIESRKDFASRIMKKGEVVEVTLTSQELQTKLDQWCSAIYEHDVHSGIKTTPWEKANNWTQPLKRISNVRALDMLLSPIDGFRTIGKKGIKVGNHNYFSTDSWYLTGLKVQVRTDETNIGKVFVYALDGEYLGMAQSNELLGISSAEAATAIKNRVKKFALQQKSENKAHTKVLKGNVADVVLEHRIEQSKNVTKLPQAFEEYTTPALEQFGIAADHKDGKLNESSPLNDQELALQAELEKELSQPAQIIEVFATEEDRYERAYKLERGDHLSADDAKWLSIYQKSSEYKIQKEIYEDFGITIELDEAK